MALTGTIVTQDANAARLALADAERVFDLPGVLPPAPNTAVAEMWLRGVRRHFLAAA